MPRLLIVKTSSLGDVIHNLPILADIRNHYPDMIFDWVVEESFAEIPTMHPAVATVIPVAIRRWRRNLLAPAVWHEMTAFRDKVRAQQYNYILDTQGLLKSALITRIAHGTRHGLDRQSAREPLASVFYDQKHRVPRGQHAVARNRQLAALALGYPESDTPPDYGLHAIPATLLPINLPPSYVVGLHATSRDSKLWPTENWIALGSQLIAQGMHLVLPWGNEQEHQRAQVIATDVPDAIVLPRLTLKELASILSGARGIVGVDTGLVHLAVALDVPTVALYIHSDHTLTGAYSADSQHSRNLGGIGKIPDVATVIAAFKSVTDQE